MPFETIVEKKNAPTSPLDHLYQNTLMIGLILPRLYTMTPKIESIHQTSTFRATLQRNNDIFSRCKL